MENRRIYIVLISLILIGLALQNIKRLSLFQSAGKSKSGNIELAYVDSQPYFRNSDKDAEILKNSKAGFKLSGLGTSGQTVFNHGDANADANAKKAQGKSTEKKKKKKKKKKTSQPSGEFEYEYYTEDKKSAPAKTEPLTASAPLVEPPVNKELDDKLKTYAEWERRLFARPDLKETTKFIQAYQSGLVPDETFYDLVQKMYDQDRVDYQELAVLAWGSTPGLVSFVQLAEVSMSQNAVSSKANSELKNYQSINLVWVLRSVLIQFNSGAPLIAAARALDGSTRTYLAAPAAADTDPTTSRQARNPSDEEAKRPIRTFASMLPLMENRLKDHQSEPAIAEPLQAAVDRIRAAMPNMNPPGSTSLEPLANSQ